MSAQPLYFEVVVDDVHFVDDVDVVVVVVVDCMCDLCCCVLIPLIMFTWNFYESCIVVEVVQSNNHSKLKSSSIVIEVVLKMQFSCDTSVGTHFLLRNWTYMISYTFPSCRYKNRLEFRDISSVSYDSPPVSCKNPIPSPCNPLLPTCMPPHPRNPPLYRWNSWWRRKLPWSHNQLGCADYYHGL